MIGWLLKVPGWLGLAIGIALGAGLTYGVTRFEVSLVEFERDTAVKARNTANGEAATATATLQTYEATASAAAVAQKAENDANWRALENDRRRIIEESRAQADRHIAERADFDRRLRNATAPRPAADRPGVPAVAACATEESDQRVAGWLAYFGEQLSENGRRVAAVANSAAACDAQWESIEKAR